MRGAENREESEVDGRESDPEMARQAGILAALEVPIEPKRSSLSYRLSVALATLVVLALPLVYVALAVAVGWTAVWTARSGRIAWTIMAGAVFLLLCKALFARPVRIVRPRRLEPEEQPFLFEFVRRLSKRLRAPAPKRIYVNLEVNASASFLWGAGFVHDDLALTIGLPLVSSTNLGQFTAVLAHEFGHFAQGSGMRSRGLAAAVNRWFARVVYQRDTLDLALDKLAEAASHIPYTWGFTLVFLGARGCIWLTRRLLHLLMVVSSRITALLSRQMEFDADQNAVRLCGSETFVRFLRLLPVIEASSGWAAALNEQQLREGTLSDDYPELVGYGLEELGDVVKARIVEQAMNTTAGMYASHPPARQRIARAQALGLAGRFASEAPASVLFEEYSALCRELTASRYEAELGRALDPGMLVPTAAAFASLKSHHHAQDLANAYFHGVPFGPQSFELGQLEIGPPEQPELALETLARARRESGELAARAKAASGRLDALEEQLCLTAAAHALRARLFRWKIEKLAPLMERDDLEQELQRLRAAVEDVHGEIEPFARSMLGRIQCAVGLLQVPSVRARLADPDALFERGRNALRAFLDLHGAARETWEAGRTMSVIGFLFGGEHALPTDEPTQRSLNRTHAALIAELNGRLRAWHERLAGKRYPFASVQGPTDLQGFFFPTLPGNTVPERNLAAARRALDCWMQLGRRLRGEIGEVGTEVETASSSPRPGSSTIVRPG